MDDLNINSTGDKSNYVSSVINNTNISNEKNKESNDKYSNEYIFLSKISESKY